MSSKRETIESTESETADRVVVAVGWDAISRPILRYRDELSLPDYLRTVVKGNKYV